jgi:hypothetical protein
MLFSQKKTSANSDRTAAIGGGVLSTARDLLACVVGIDLHNVAQDLSPT